MSRIKPASSNLLIYNDMPPNVTSYAPPRLEAARALPAWLLSTVMHVLGLVLMTLALHRSTPETVEETGRPVGIVLATTAQDVAYFKPTAEQISQQQASNPATSAASGETQPTTPFPSDDATHQSSAMHSPDLPGEFELADGGQGLLHDVVASGGGRAAILPGLGDAEILANDPLLNAPPAAELGPTATMSIFGTRSVGRSFIFLIDRSKSMGGEGLGAIEAAQQELSRAFSSLTAAQRFQIVAYNQRLSANTEKLEPATDEGKTLAGKYVSGIVAHGKTEHNMALLAALRNSPEVIYVFTDAGEPELTQAEMHTITLRAAGKTTIHGVQFGFGPLQDDAPFLKKLTRLTGGSFAYVDMSKHRVEGNFSRP